MDAWSSPWGDDGTQPSASTSDSVTKDDEPLTNPTAVPFSSLNTFDASDPWSNDAPTPSSDSGHLPERETVTSVGNDMAIGTGISTLQGSSFASVAWGDTSIDSRPSPPKIASPSNSHQLPATDSERRTPPARQHSLPSSYDPWAANTSSAGWGAEPHDSSSALTTSDDEIRSNAWGPTGLTFTLSQDLEERFSSENIADRPREATPVAAADDEQEETGTNLDVWAAEASSREEKARCLDREEIDRLKVDARKLISSINTDKDTQASFAQPSSSEGGWTDLFGSQGSQREKLHHLQTPPSSLLSPSGALRPDILQTSTATLGRVRSSIANTENRGVKLTSVDNSLSWQRASRPTTKADWLPDHFSAEADGLSLGGAAASASANASNSMSGPGWMQTSGNETRTASGPSFLASFFKNRQASAGSAAASIDTAPSPTIPQARESRSSASSFEASPRLPADAQFEPYQDAARSTYTDDPTGPDLMSLDTIAAPASAAPSKPAPPAAPAQGPSLLSRWRNSGLFKSSAKKQNPSWASTSLQGDDLAWLEEHESSDSRTSRYHYDDDADADDSFASFRNAAPRPPLPPAKPEAASATKPLDPFDSVFGPAVQTSLQSGASPTATSSARSSLSGSRMSGESGMMTINTNLARTSSIARKSAASPLQPPPQAQSKRISIAPPPRGNAASPSALGSKPPQSMADPFADFLSDAPSQQVSNATAVKKPPPAPTATEPSTLNSKGGGLTADDLLFFDSL